jgi:small subunit ribosomal protein S13
LVEKKKTPEEKAKEEKQKPETMKETPKEPNPDTKHSPEETESQSDHSEKQGKDSVEPQPDEQTLETTSTKEEKKELPEKTKSTKEEKKELPEKTKKETPKEKPEKTEEKKPIEKKDEVDSDFKYIVRIANTDVDGERTIIFGLTQIKGVGRRMAILLADIAGIPRSMKMGDLSDQQIEKISQILENLNEKLPGWMLNHRKDLDTGKDIHLVSSDVDMRLRDDVNLMKMIRCYRGIRHEMGLRVRGQRTRANNRSGLSLGVSKKSP